MKSNLRHPGATTRISDNWADHRARGSLGGTDFVDAYGTLVLAALDGAYVSIVDNSPDGSGGRVCRVTGPDGDSVERLHHHAVTAARGQRVNAEDVVGISGASAFGSNTGTGGPHIHEHGVTASGVRFNLEPYYWFLNGGSSPAGGNITPIQLTQEDALNDLNPATKDFITDTVHDQVRSLLVEDQANGEKSIVNQLAAIVAAQVDRAISATQREQRFRLYRLKDGPRRGRFFARDNDDNLEVEFSNPKTLWADIDTLKRVQLVAPKENVVELSQSDYDKLREPFASAQPTILQPLTEKDAS